jgi:hypothetical protein
VEGVRGDASIPEMGKNRETFGVWPIVENMPEMPKLDVCAQD